MSRIVVGLSKTSRLGVHARNEGGYHLLVDGDGTFFRVEATADGLEQLARSLQMFLHMDEGKCPACAREAGDLTEAFCEMHRKTYRIVRAADMGTA